MASGRAKAAILFDGIAEMSALGRVATELLAEFADVAFSAGTSPEARPWCRAVHGTALQWWSDAGPAAAPGAFGALDTTVDLGRRATGQGGRSWCIVDAAGAPLFQPFHALSVCYMEPYVASLSLIESEDGGTTWQLVADAHVSSARPYSELLDLLGRTAMRLLRMALCGGTAPRRPWVPEPARPGPTQTLRGARLASGAAWLRARIGGEIYGIATLDRRPEEFLLDQRCPVTQWIQVPPSQGFIADPFFWPGQPGVLLCETYRHRTGLGELTALSIDAGRVVGSESLPLGVECHLSYPSTWADGERVLCLPEMAASRRQVLYELKRGMAPIPLCVVGEDVGMADPTLMKVDGLYWIGYTDTDIGTYDNLCLLHAPRLEGPWSPHVGNPVKIDARSSRPGGTPFRIGDKLYRPAQDCSREYGGALTVNRVMLCTPGSYQEEPVAMLRPDPNGAFPDGLHTLSFGNGLAVIDGKRNSYHPAILGHKLGRRLAAIPFTLRFGWRR
jgi:hypothetical protein